MKKLLRNLFFLCLLGGALGALAGYLIWGAVGLWMSLIGAMVVWLEEQYDPFHRYQKAFYRATIVDYDEGQSWEKTIVVLLIEETENYYRVRFPLSWRIFVTPIESGSDWVEKDQLSLIG